ncbi:hypothetical protein PA7_48030 [Pseudonocardia asaccharolytica DSM 44247 = NBRC 16224]|uniref:Uncharacterized protein n=1 Tax=Pseudonocardia asaccharolytica DSM 44247 = NBRC 16224 TaxID=1123024 RepID=A0A511D867_9PSEU|nr:hypothetical protein PA7_48030 [Pseudonocardia asaccharolytica DSM 44247 = NBRC 16224]
MVRDPARFRELHAGAIARVGDAGKAEDVTALSAGQDVVITATRPAPGLEHELVTTPMRYWPDPPGPASG